MIPYKENLQANLKKVLKKIDSKFDDIELELDFATYVTSDSKVYEEVVKNLSKENEILEESADGVLIQLDDEIEIGDIEFEKVLIRKPKGKNDDSFWGEFHFNLEKGEASDFDLDNVKVKFNTVKKESNKSKDDTKETDKEDFEALYNEEKEKRLRILADMENEKKRIERQKDEFMRLANVALVTDLFEIVDDLKRAIDNGTDKSSLEMIHNKTLGILNNYGIIPVDVKEGDDFNPEKMEAVTTTDAGDDKVNKVVHIEQAGFLHKEDNRVLRACRVIVGK